MRVLERSTDGRRDIRDVPRADAMAMPLASDNPTRTASFGVVAATMGGSLEELVRSPRGAVSSGAPFVPVLEREEREGSG